MREIKSLLRQRGFIGVGAAILGGTIGSSLIGGIGANRAAQTQADAANIATQAQLQMFGQTEANLAPWMQQGNVALGQIGQGLQPGGQFSHMFGMQDFQQSPAYQFNLQQGQQAIDKAANSRGNLYAPQTLKDLGGFTQGLASNEFQNAFNNYQTGVGNIWNRLYNTSQSGQNAAANLGGFGTTTAGQIGNNMIGAGNAQAAGQMGVANSLAGGLSGLTNYAMINQLLSQQQQPTYNQSVNGYIGPQGYNPVPE